MYLGILFMRGLKGPAKYGIILRDSSAKEKIILRDSPKK